jgi:PhnB protein
MKINPYLSFDGHCREAFDCYAQVLGGRVVFIQTYGESPMATQMPADVQNRVMHVSLQVGDQVLQGADAPPGQFSTPAGFCVAIHLEDAEEGRRVFQALSDDGVVQMAFQPTFWAEGFGMLIDRFGVPWTVNAGQRVAG